MARTKTEEIEFCIRKIEEILDYLRPGNNWNIEYNKPEFISILSWKKEYLGIVDGEDYFFIYVDGDILYAVNVTGDSVLTAIQELVNKLAAKF